MKNLTCLQICSKDIGIILTSIICAQYLGYYGNPSIELCQLRQYLTPLLYRVNAHLSREVLNEFDELVVIFQYSQNSLGGKYQYVPELLSTLLLLDHIGSNGSLPGPAQV